MNHDTGTHTRIRPAKVDRCRTGHCDVACRRIDAPRNRRGARLCKAHDAQPGKWHLSAGRRAGVGVVGGVGADDRQYQGARCARALGATMPATGK